MIVKYLECFLVMSWPCAEGLLLQQRNYWSSRHHHRKNNKQQLCYNVAFKLSNYAGLIENNNNMIFHKRLMFDVFWARVIIVFLDNSKDIIIIWYRLKYKANPCCYRNKNFMLLDLDDFKITPSIWQPQFWRYNFVWI